MPAPGLGVAVADMDGAVHLLQSEVRTLPSIVGIHPAEAGLPKCLAMLPSITCFSILLNFLMHGPYLLLFLIFFLAHKDS
jgi:hypothetical protein